MTAQLSEPSNTHRFWYGVSVFQITLLIHVVLYILTPDVGESTQFQLLAVGLFTQAFLVFGVTTGLSTILSKQWLSRIGRLQGVYLFGAIGILFVFGVLMRHEWVYAHAGLVLSATFGLGYITFFADQSYDRVPRWVMGIALIVGVLFIILKINALAVYPHIIPTDESWLLGWPLAWVRGVYPNDLLFFNGGEDVFHYFIPMGIWMQVVGTGFVQARIYQLLMTLVLMVIMFPLVQRLYDKQTAWLTVLMLFAGSVVVLATTIRHDIGLGILLTLSFLIHRIAIDRNQQRLHFVAGLMVGFGLFTHYHAIAFGPALMVALYAPYYVRDFRSRGWRFSKGLVLYAIGGLVGAGIVFGVQILPQLDAVLGVREFRSEGVLGVIQSYFEYFAVLAELSQFEFVLVVTGMMGLLIRHKLVDIQILLMILLGHLGLAVLAAQVTLDYYVIPLAPFYALAIVTLFTRPLRMISKHVMGWVTLLFVAVTLGFTMSTPIKYALDGKMLDDAPAPQGIHWIKENVPVGSRIVGDLYYSLWLTDYEFYASTSDRYLASEYREIYQSSFDLWVDVNPDYLIFDPNIPTYDMQRVLDSGFLDDNFDYEVVARIQGSTHQILIYGRVESD
jgi:hypothetical protein